MSKRTLCLLLCICLYASAFPAPQNDSGNITTPPSVDDVSVTTVQPQSPSENQENSSNPATGSDSPSDNQEDTESQEPDAGDQAGTVVQISSDSEQETNSENQVPNEEDQETVTENQAPNSEDQESGTENEAPNAEGAENQVPDDSNQESGTENQASDANQESSTDNEGSRVNNQEPSTESQASDNDNQGPIKDDATNPEEEVGTDNSDDEILVIGDNNAKDDGLSPPIDRTKFFVKGPFFPGPAPSLLGVTNAFGMHMRALSQDIGFETRVCHELLNRHFELVSGKCIMVPIFSPHNREFVAERKKKINGEKFICQELHINSVLGAIQEFCVSKKHWEFHTRDSGIYV